MNIQKEIANIKHVYNLIVKDGKAEYKDEYICSFQIVNNNSIQSLPKKYIKLYKELSESI
jgi:hypothetical protein